jgi:hypothetical protein
MAMGSTQPLAEMSTRNRPGSKRQPVLGADNLTAICEPTVCKRWESRRLATLWAFRACYRDSFTFTFMSIPGLYKMEWKADWWIINWKRFGRNRPWDNGSTILAFTWAEWGSHVKQLVSRARFELWTSRIQGLTVAATPNCSQGGIQRATSDPLSCRPGCCKSSGLPRLVPLGGWGPALLAPSTPVSEPFSPDNKLCLTHSENSRMSCIFIYFIPKVSIWNIPLILMHRIGSKSKQAASLLIKHNWKMALFNYARLDYSSQLWNMTLFGGQASLRWRHAGDVRVDGLVKTERRKLSDLFIF